MSETPCSGLRCTALFTRAQSSEARPGKSASTTMTSSALICLFFSVAVIISSSVEAAETDLPHVEISNWAIRFGAQMWEIGKQVTRIREIRERYQSEAKIEQVDGFAMVKEMAEEMENMMGDKIEAIKRIMDAAEHLSVSHSRLTRQDLYEMKQRNENIDYYNAKRLNQYHKAGPLAGELLENHKALIMSNSLHFGNVGINTSVSAVHVPTNVYDGAPDVLNGIQWSEQLDRIFMTNYESDPSLTWQYFGSSTGFMRQYPATKWGQGEWEPDLFDCRLRPWYLQAAASPKDMIILVDTSGSMTGVRKEIAKHVVLTLLDTLSENDFINIYKFSEVPVPVVPCFKDKVVQANLENLRELRNGMIETETSDIANFTSAFTTAFEILQKYNRTMQGCQCNQAIMLVTDGAPENYKEHLEKYNLPHRPVRIFSYVIGREIIDTSATINMACENKGYFARVTSLAEVREQVLKYIPVLSRPMVMYQKDHPVIWTSAYIDIAEPKLSDWLWEIRERRKQRDRSLNYRALLRLISDRNNAQSDDTSNVTTNSSRDASGRPTISMTVEQYLTYGNLVNEERLNAHRIKQEREEAAIPAGNQQNNRQGTRTKPKFLMAVSVATPVYDRKNESNIIEKILINDIWEEKTRTVRTANLLGVAGTDIPVTELKKRTPAYKLGVNGYSFIVNNNGYVLYHPDHRPLDADGLLKPNYNTVDLSEIELVDSDGGPRENDTNLMTMRRDMIERREGEMTFKVRIHHDGMKRVSVRRQRYYYRGLKGTPYSLGLALPDGYGDFRIAAETEVKRLSADHNINVSSFFSGKNWKIHPDWIYCRYNYDHLKSFDTPEAQVLHFVGRTQRERWRWNSKHPRPSHDTVRSHKQEDNYYCDKHLMQSLIFDAQATEVFDKNISLSIDRQDPGLGMLMALLARHAMFKLFGISVAFVATRSGLLRWQDISTIDDNLHVVRRRHAQWDRQTRRVKRAPRKPFQFKKRFQSRILRKTIRLDIPFIIRRRKPARHFSEANLNAIDQTWYKRAVDQYSVEPDSFVYSVPFSTGTGVTNESVVTASHAIFVEKGGYKAPAAVVGLQYKNSAFRETFFNITSGCTGGVQCRRTCSSGDLSCYVVDNHGYIVISKEERDTGRFFGEIDWLVMDSLIHYGVFKRVRIYDYQAVCKDMQGHRSAANFLLTPLRYMKWFVQWMVGRASWIMLQTQIAHLINPDWAWGMEQEQSDYHYEDNDGSPGPVPTGGEFMADGDISIIVHDEAVSMENAYANKSRPRPCDQQADLYVLQPEKLFKGDKPDSVKGKQNCNSNNLGARQCERHYSTHKIPHSNLLLLVIDTTCRCEIQKQKIEMEEVKMNESLRCERPQESLYRQRPSVCLSYHPEEEEIKQCGKGNNLLPSPILLTATLIYSVLKWI
ncbi:voltage-dependent calcium channel subunit alpha-2/delta-3-like isoform X4 [Daphnia pulex]|uniref:voltage-dependent calcium channel subunit alpha-2/delta-3-like isoform X4 n=1 Tax=Daphnia pulex TaxID=6669 RepID=UPI001EDF76E3|nr:voltage-dependent calcium channel subunit alpha-2/delta-3-like isoform X4 [Daphnia pulex]